MFCVRHQSKRDEFKAKIIYKQQMPVFLLCNLLLVFTYVSPIYSLPKNVCFVLFWKIDLYILVKSKFY